MPEIEGLQDMVKPFLNIGEEIQSYTIRSLIGPGENYGSVMSAVDVLLNDNKKLHLVAKTCPTTEFIKQSFNTAVTFKKEVVFYNSVVPSLQNFLKRNDQSPMQLFPKYYGSRYSLDPGRDEVDDNCCLLLENIKVKGYDIGDRMQGFDYECTMFIIKDLAKFHAVPVAMKLKEPARFEEEICKLVRPPSHCLDEFTEDLLAQLLDELSDCLKNIPKYKDVHQKLMNIFTKTAPNFYKHDTDIVEPFASIVHSDLWTNNTMIKKDAQGRIIRNRFVDFQMIAYGNPFADLMFFLYTSVEIPVLKAHYNEFINTYFDSFMHVLKDIKVDNLEEFSKGLYLKEIDRCMMRVEMLHSLFMLTPIFTKKEEAKPLEDYHEHNLFDMSKIDQSRFFERMTFILDDFQDKKWLNL